MLLLEPALLFLVVLGAPKSIIECPTFPPRPNPPTTVRDVRVDEIKVIAALGDSITAGYSAVGFANPNQTITINNLVENRGVSFAIGGETNATTVGNFMARYVPNIRGRSVGDHGPNLCTPNFCFGRYTPSIDRFNAARTGAVVRNFENQLPYLLEQIRADRTINIQNDFKFLSILIGANDICNSCNNPVSADTYESNLKKVLLEIKRQLPRTIVNVHQLFEVSQLWDLTASSAFCDRRKANRFTAECTCAFLEHSNGATKRKEMDELTAQFNERIKKVSQDPELNDDSFMVISDPSAAGFQLRNATLEYLSNVDCFHPSVKAHRLLATGAWNNLFLSQAEKKQYTELEFPVNCPSADSRFRN